MMLPLSDVSGFSDLANVVPVDWHRWSNAKPAVIRPLTGGLTNQSFLLSAGDAQVVLRKNSAISDSLNLNRPAEADALQRADKAGLSAPLVYCDPEHQYLVTRYVEGKQWCVNTESEHAESQYPESHCALAQLAQLLRNIHQLPASNARLDIEEKIANYWLSIDAQASFVADLKSLDQKIGSHIHNARSLSDSTCLCHNDLLAENLIVTTNGKLLAIDWEYAAMGDAFYDLAVIAEGQGLTGQQQQRLLAEYLGRAVTSEDWLRLYHWRVIYGYLTVQWYAVQWSAGTMQQPDICDVIADKIYGLSELMAEVAG